METKIINSLGKPWDFAHTQRIEKYITAEYITCRSLEMSKVIEVSGLLLKYPKIGNYLYELLLDLFDSADTMTRIKNTLKELTSKIYIYDYVIEMRNIILGTDNFGSDILSAIMRASGLILQAYNLGRLEGVITEKQQVIVSDLMDPLDLSLMFLVDINRRRQLIKKVQSSNKLYDTDVKRFNKYLRNKDNYEAVNQVQQLDDKTVVEVANNAIASMPYAYVGNLFNEVDRYFYPNYDVLQTASWEREQTSNPTSSVILYFKFLINKLFDKDILRNRKFYVREKGVRIIFEKAVNDIASIELREVHVDNEFDEHYINFFYTLNTGETRMFYLSMKDITKSETPLLYEKDAEVSLMVLAWLGLLEGFVVKAEDIKRTANGYDEDLGEKGYQVLADSINKWIEHSISSMNSRNYYYETPTQWNYQSYGTNKVGVGQGYSVAKLIKVGRYMRRLPAGQKPSPEAIALARKFYIELKEGYTLVDEFEKLQRVKN